MKITQSNRKLVANKRSALVVIFQEFELSERVGMAAIRHETDLKGKNN